MNRFRGLFTVLLAVALCVVGYPADQMSRQVVTSGATIAVGAYTYDGDQQHSARMHVTTAMKPAAGDATLRSSAGARGVRSQDAASRFAAEAGGELAAPTAGGLASDLADVTGGTLKELKSGYSVTIPSGSRGIVVRVMEEGGDRTNYWRISIPGKQAFTVGGEASTESSLDPHPDIRNLASGHSLDHRGTRLMGALNDLWGAVLDELSVELTTQTVRLTAHVTNGSDVVTHELELHDVSEFRFHSAIPSPWDYAEITEAHLGRAATGGVSIEFVLWSEDAGISVRAGSATFNGSSVIAP